MDRPENAAGTSLGEVLTPDPSDQEAIMGWRRSGQARFSGGLVGSCRMSDLRRKTTRTAWQASFGSMDGWERRTVRLEAGDLLRLSFAATVGSGALRLDVLTPDGSAVAQSGGSPAETLEVVASSAGKYALVVTAEKASGDFLIELLEG